MSLSIETKNFVTILNIKRFDRKVYRITVSQFSDSNLAHNILIIKIVNKMILFFNYSVINLDIQLSTAKKTTCYNGFIEAYDGYRSIIKRQFLI